MKALAAIAGFALTALCSSACADDAVTLRRVPNGGIKPSAAVDEAGMLHLVYFSGKPEGGDAFYVTSRDGGATFSAPLRANSQPGSVLGASSIRGPKLALGRQGRVHVAWNGSSVATPKAPLNPAMPADSPFNGTPLLYTRLADDGKSFEPQRNVIQRTCALDGGSDLAADREGRVFVVFHAQLPGAKSEAERAVFVATSTDDGRTFAEERNALPEPTGVCACCSLAAWVDNGNLYILYRGATESVHRGMHRLTSSDGGKTFSNRALDDWQLATCPMSACTLATGPNVILAAWENAGQVQFNQFALAGGDITRAPGENRDRKYPVTASNRSAQTLFAWTEGMGWNRGGALAWQRYDLKSKAAEAVPVGEPGQANGVPANGSIAAVALPDGKFVILY